MNAAGALYSGIVVHRRLRPAGHLLKYRVFNLLLNLDRLDEVKSTSRLLNINNPGLLSFRERDHGDGRKRGLNDWVREQLIAAGVTDAHDLTINALCYPRIFGYVFNPITVYFCTDASGSARAFLYEVNNTMGERHTYVIPIDGQVDRDRPYRQRCDKAMYVSPFTPMNCRYDFRIIPPGERVTVGIQQSDDDGPLLNASFVGERQSLSGQSLAVALLRHPLMTLKVIAGIHLEAFRLWRKGVPVFRHTPQQKGEISIVRSQIYQAGAD